MSFLMHVRSRSYEGLERWMRVHTDSTKRDKTTGFCKREFKVQTCRLLWYARSRFCVEREDARLMPKIQVKSCSQAINYELGDAIGFCV